MSNVFGLKRDDAYIGSTSLSNGITDAFISCYLIAGTPLVRNEWQRRLVSFCASKDQTTFGAGAVGFDINEMPWTSENLESEKQFVIKIVEQIKVKNGWGQLRYAPSAESEPILFQKCDEFVAIIKQIEPGDIYTKPLPHDPEVIERREFACEYYGRCKRHDVPKHEHSGDGCLICLNEDSVIA